MERFAYFMIRVLRPGSSTAADRVAGEGKCLTGRVEHLDTGEKRIFRNAEELLRFLTSDDPSHGSNVPPPMEHGNT